jgi:hypothetical protein
MAAATGLFLVFVLFTTPLFSMVSFKGGAEEQGFIQQQVVNSDPPYYLLRQASAQEGDTPPSTLPFTPFSLQQQETVPSSPTNATGTTPPTNDTEGGAVTELTSSATEPPLRVEAIANATQAVAPATIRLDANITGGAPPYSYSWSDPNLGLIDLDRNITLNFFEPGTFTYTLTVTDSRGKVVTDNVQIVISERLPQGGGRGVTVAPEPGGVAPPGEEGVPLTVEIIPNATEGIAPATFQFDSKVTGGTAPYNYRWKLLTGRFTPEYFGTQLVLAFQIPGTYTIVLNVTDSTGRTGSDSVEITVGGLSELPPSDLGEVVPPPEGGGVLLPPETGQEGQPQGGGLLPATTPAANDTGGNDTGGGVTEQPLTVEIIPNATEGIAPATIAFDSKVTGGTAPYTYQWRALGVILEAEFHNAAGFVKELPYPNSFYFILNVTDSKGQTASDTVAIYIKEQPSEGGGEVLLPPETGQEGQPPGALLSQTPPSPPPPPLNDNGEVVSPPPEGETGGTPSTTEQEGEEPSPPPPPPSDDTGEEGEGTPPSGDDTTGGG